MHTMDALNCSRYYVSLFYLCYVKEMEVCDEFVLISLAVINCIIFMIMERLFCY